MAFCKNCIHVEVCKEEVKSELYPDEFDASSVENWEADNCEHFIDRSRIIELPCIPGDVIYRICPVSQGEKCCNCSWEYCDCYDIGFQHECYHNSVRAIKAGNSEWLTKRIPYFGEIYFLTPEAAESALKRYKHNLRELNK